MAHTYDKNKRFVAWLAVVCWMALIFYLSHQPASASSQLSSGITALIASALDKVLPFLTIDWENFHAIIRKSAHFFAYFMLGAMTINALRISRVSGSKGIVIAFIVCVLYAISDEVHQLFIPGRSGEVRDVLIDSTGAIVGIIFYQWLKSLVVKFSKAA